MPLQKRLFLATLLFTGTLGAALPAYATGNDFLGGKVSANIAMLNDYRFRGISLNNEGFAIQGGFDWSHESGLYVGTWATNISDFNGASIESDFYGGYSGEANGVSFDIGGLLYHYPGGTGTDYTEVYGSTGIDLGFLSTTVGANYAFSNNNLGNQDNIYIYTDSEVAIPNMPLSLNLHLGFEDGAFGNKKWDWIIGTKVSYQGVDFGVSYVDTNVSGNNSDGRVVFSVGASF